MKNKIFAIAIFLGLLASCTSKFEEYNTDTKNPVSIPGEYVFSHAQYLLSYHMMLNNVNVGIFNLMAQYITETTYTDEANWDLVNRRIADNWWRRMYYDLNELKIAQQLIEAAPDLGQPKVKANKIAIIKIMKAYIWQILVDVFGNVPYTQALDPVNTLPVYDDAKTIYLAQIDSLKAAYAQLDENEPSFGQQDLIYGGNVSLWKKFAASLLVKYAITMWDDDPEASKPIIEQYYDKTFSSLSEGAYFPFKQTSPYQNPIYEDFVASGRQDFVLCQTLIDQMEVTDPRLSVYGNDTTFKYNTEGKIINGGIYGDDNTFAKCAQIGKTVLAPDFNGFLLTYDEILFYLAEAAARGANVGKTAAQLYADAITASFQYWTGSIADVPAYLALRPYVDIKSIAKEGWIAMYLRGLIGWTFYRRVDGAFNLIVPPTNVPGINQVPTRYTYPINEQTLNRTNYQAAAAAIGGDFLTTKIFWDKQ